MRRIQIFDTTLRDGEQSPGCSMNIKEKIDMARQLEYLGVDVIEAGFAAASQGDFNAVRAVAKELQKTRVASLSRALAKDIDSSWEAIRYAKYPRIHVFIATSDIHMEDKLKKTREEVLEQTSEMVRYAKKLCEDVEFSAEDATRSDAEFLYRAIETAISAGASIVTLVDGSEGMLPARFGQFIKDAYAHVPALSSVLLGVQCADGLSLAAAAALSAVEAGAGLVKTSTGGDGVLPLETLANILRSRGVELNLSSNIAMTELSRAAGQVRWMVSAKREAASAYEAGAARSAEETVVLSSESSLSDISAAVQKLGYDLSEEDNAKVYAAFLRIADKKNVGEKELDAIVASAALQVPPTYTMESYVINSGNVITATAQVKLLKQGKTLSGFAVGDGPIDAAFLAIEQIIGHHYELDDFQIQAVTEGREAMGSALVRLREDGKLYSGKGISTDIIGASIHAYLNALNKIVYEEGARA